MFWSKRRTIRQMSHAIMDLHDQLDAERKITDSLQRALVAAVDPNRDDPFVIMPDGEPVAPEAYDWERLAHDIWDNETGGASGSW